MTRILLIEDNELNRDMFARRLARHGYEVLTAADGAEGLALTVTEEPDLILLDLRLPVVDGWQVARQLKADPAIRWIPILALTAYAIAGDRERALEAGCDEYETKPVNFDQLLEKIEMLLGESERER